MTTVGDLAANAPIPEAAMGTGTSGLAKGGFSAYRSAAGSYASNAAVVFDGKDIDVSNWFSTSTGRYTPQVEGVFRLSALLTRVGSGALGGDYLYTGIEKDSGGVKTVYWSEPCNGGDGGRAAPLAAGVTALVSAVSGDYFRVLMQHTYAGAQPVQTGIGYTRFQGELVGRT